MKPEILDFVKTQRCGVLAIEMMDGSPHGATVHFANSDDPFVFYFETNTNYRKTEALNGREKSRATFVIGTGEDIMKTMQMDGVVKLLKEEEIEEFNKVYLDKFPEKKEKMHDDVILFKFTPTWWRYTDWTDKNGKKILTSI